MSPRAVAAIQARTGSSRLPGKVLADVAGEPLILRVVERVRRAALVDEVVVLTSVEPGDDALASLLESREVPVRRGPLEDVLARYLALVEELQPRFVVRVTGDCPLVEPSFVDLQLGALEALDADFVRVAGDANAVEGTLGGQAALSARALDRAAGSDDPRDREHAGSFFFRRERHAFRHVEVEVDPVYHRPGLRLSVDEAEDLELVRAVFEALAGRDFSTADALRWLDAHPELSALNAAVQESADNQALRGMAADVSLVGRWR